MIATVLWGRRRAQWNIGDCNGIGRGERSAYFGPQHGALQTPVLSRDMLADCVRNDPLIVLKYDTSVVVPPSCLASLDASSHLDRGRGNLASFSEECILRRV
ncbi:MAG: hypothetical protein SGI92_27290 [Bryobacteraceae bacterium]|nr:hypothetical protein [Bryobacteraceae bacterium]